MSTTPGPRNEGNDQVTMYPIFLIQDTFDLASFGKCTPASRRRFDMQAGTRAPHDAGRPLPSVSGRRSLGTQVYQTLREAVVLNVFAPGEPLRQAALAEALGVSRIPVRSALLRLAADGLVELGDRKGAVVTAHTAAQARELYDIRIVLETHAVRQSMRAMTPERVRTLRALSDLAESKRAEMVDARRAYYAELFDVTNNPELVRLLEELRLKLGRYIFGWRLRHPHDEAHNDVLNKIAAGDEAGVIASVEANLCQVRDGIVEMIKEEEQNRAVGTPQRSLTLRERLMEALDRGRKDDT
ncbi:GntR family transcriptional regulator [Mycolicibacterium agri]|nr:GntR family transcriptional regulator [Mycolicibacterium agri]